MKPAISRSVVVLPQPDGPSRQTSWPCSISNDTSVDRDGIAIALAEALQFDCGHVSSLSHTLFKSPDARYIARPHRKDRLMQEQKIYGTPRGRRRPSRIQQSRQAECRVARHVGRLRRHPEGLRQGSRGALRRGERRGRQGLRVRRRHLQVRERARQCRGAGALRRDLQGGLRGALRFPQADHRQDHRLLHRRRHEPRRLLRPALLQRGRALRRAGGQARPGLRLPAHRAAVAHRRPAARHGVPVHRQAVFRRRKPTRWAW